MDNPIALWKNVSDTLLIPLYCRARETENPAPLIQDPMAVRMLKDIRSVIAGSTRSIHRKILADSYNKKLLVTMALRTRRFDRYVSEFLSLNPGGTVINLGCGLDSRFSRLDNGQMQWFDIDFPPVLELKKQYFPATDRYQPLAASALDEGWINTVRAKNPKAVLVLAEGLLMYLPPDDVKALFARLAYAFPGCVFAFENTHTRWVRAMKNPWMRFKMQRQLGISPDSFFRFGVADAQEIMAWDKRYRFLDEWSYFDDNEPRLGWFNLFGRFEYFRKVQWSMRFKLG